MKRKSKTEMVLEIYDREAMGEVTPHEIAIINRGLIEEFGEGGRLSPAEIASILIDEDLPVRFDQVFNMSTPEERYDQLFSSVIDLSTLATAERSIQKMHFIHRELLAEGDRRGAQYALEIARTAKATALRESADDRCGNRRSAELREIAEWFTIWLQTPDLFEQWHDVRKATAEYRRTFAATEDT